MKSVRKGCVTDARVFTRRSHVKKMSKMTGYSHQCLSTVVSGNFRAVSQQSKWRETADDNFRGV